jgi:hypothetical protein
MVKIKPRYAKHFNEAGLQVGLPRRYETYVRALGTVQIRAPLKLLALVT